MPAKWILSLIVAFGLAAGAARAATPVTLRAADGVLVSGLAYAAPHPKALLLLFHQAGSSKAEYASIAPRLVAAGYAALAIDQRSGGSLFGPNDTAARLQAPADYLQAKPDLVAALDWARSRQLPVVLWGSSYSAALVFEVAAEHPAQVSALIAFSPGEYLGDGEPVAKAAGRVRVPIYVTSAASAEEIEAARRILAASPSPAKTQYVPAHSVHGSSALIEARDPQGAAEHWKHLLAFLATLPARGS